MASRAPWTLSTPAVSGVSERSPSTTTTGRSSDSDWAIRSTGAVRHDHDQRLDGLLEQRLDGGC